MPTCDGLGEAACRAEQDCIWSEFTRYELREGVCEAGTPTGACFERENQSAGCLGWSCGPAGGAAPWVDADSDSAARIAEVDVCGAGIAEWTECVESDNGFDPPICACACE